jgi:hypothetical protein
LGQQPLFAAPASERSTNLRSRRRLSKWSSLAQREAVNVSFEHPLTSDDESRPAATSLKPWSAVNGKAQRRLITRELPR